MSKITTEQKAICKKYNAKFVTADENFKVGLAKNVRKNLQPINGLRHKPESDTTGGYIWAGKKLSQDPPFFKPIHVKHLQDICPQVIKFLELAPGWRFLIDDKSYEDVWFDESLLKD